MWRGGPGRPGPGRALMISVPGRRRRRAARSKTLNLTLAVNLIRKLQTSPTTIRRYSSCCARVALSDRCSENRRVLVPANPSPRLLNRDRRSRSRSPCAHSDSESESAAGKSGTVALRLRPAESGEPEIMPAIHWQVKFPANHRNVRPEVLMFGVQVRA
jgi:hypothetical protein